MKKWKIFLGVGIVIFLLGLYVIGYKIGYGSDNSNMRLKQEVDSDNPVINDTVYKYYICVEDNFIVVYKEDRKTVYMDTGISIDGINAEDLEMIENGIPVEDITTLYRYLESYTS